MENLEKVALEQSKFISWHDISLAMWGIIITCGYGFLRFISWFATRELANFWAKIDKKMLESEERQKERLDTIDKSFKKYKDEKHGIADENASLKGSIPLLKEALDVAVKILSLDEKK